MNLVSNIGGGGDATHTVQDSWFLNLPRGAIPHLEHPTQIIQNNRADAITFRDVFMPKRLSLICRLSGIIRSPWTYGLIIRKIPLIGVWWVKWRSSVKGAKQC